MVRHEHHLAARELTDADDEVGPGDLLGQMLPDRVVELVSAVHRDRQPDVEDVLGDQAHRGRLRTQVHVNVLQRPLAHPPAQHQRLGQVDRVLEQRLDVRARQLGRKAPAAQVRDRAVQQRRHVSSQRAFDAVAEDVVSLGGVLRFACSELVERSVAVVDRRDIDLEAELLQPLDLAHDPDHRQRRVHGREVGHASRLDVRILLRRHPGVEVGVDLRFHR